jgi:hypothetical protein
MRVRVFKLDDGLVEAVVDTGLPSGSVASRHFAARGAFESGMDVAHDAPKEVTGLGLDLFGIFKLVV